MSSGLGAGLPPQKRPRQERGKINELHRSNLRFWESEFCCGRFAKGVDLSDFEGAGREPVLASFLDRMLLHSIIGFDFRS